MYWSTILEGLGNHCFLMVISPDPITDGLLMTDLSHVPVQELQNPAGRNKSLTPEATCILPASSTCMMGPIILVSRMVKSSHLGPGMSCTSPHLHISDGKHARAGANQDCHLSAGSEISASSFDSLSAVELSNSISSSLGLKLPGTLVFDYPSLPLIAQHVHSHLATTANPAAAQSPVPASLAIAPAAASGGLAVQASC